MCIRVLAVGPQDIEKLVQNVGMEFPELKIHYATYHNEEDVVEIVKDHVTEYDLLLFAGSLPFKITTKNLKLPQAKFYIPFEGTSLYRALFQLALTGNHDLQNGTLGISVDHLQKYEVEESLEELECKVREIYYYTSYDVYDINHTVQFHYDLWKNGRIDIAITCVGLVYNRLLELGVPAVRVLPTRSAVRSTLQLVLAEGLKIKNQNSQIAIGIIDLSELFNQKDLIEYQLQRKLLMIKQSVLDYGETTNAIIKWNDRREIRLITTRGKLRLEDRQNANEWRLINDIFRKTAIKVHLGIGIGRTTNEAEMHALAALKKLMSFKRIM